VKDGRAKILELDLVCWQRVLYFSMYKKINVLLVFYGFFSCWKSLNWSFHIFCFLLYFQIKTIINFTFKVPHQVTRQISIRVCKNEFGQFPTEEEDAEILIKPRNENLKIKADVQDDNQISNDPERIVFP